MGNKNDNRVQHFIHRSTAPRFFNFLNDLVLYDFIHPDYSADTIFAARRPNVMVRPQARPVKRFGYVCEKKPPVQSPVA